MADHPEHVAHAPVDQRLGHHVADRADVRAIGLDPDVDAVVANLDRERRHVSPNCELPVKRAVVVAVPGQRSSPFSIEPFAERPALVRAAVAERGVLALEVGQREAVMARADRL